VFHDQIEIKQKELQPWTGKINSKQAEIDVASSERDALKRKADAVKDALKEAQGNLDELRKGLNEKVYAHCMTCLVVES
jgi:structural maintenance of chromosome 4